MNFFRIVLFTLTVFLAGAPAIAGNDVLDGSSDNDGNGNGFACSIAPIWCS